MSARDRLFSVVDNFSEKQITSLIAFIEDLKQLYDGETEEELDMAFCVALADKHEKNNPVFIEEDYISIEELAEQWGVDLNGN